jgi:dihydroxy-acid dehydratase
MGAASVDVPAIMLTGGPALAGSFRGRRLGAGTDLWHYTDELRAGRMSAAEYDELEASSVPSVGHCSEMGTASTMASVVEALGMALPGSAAAPAVDARRAAMAEATGRRAVALADAGPRPSAVLTPAAFDNAITLLAAIGGSTNGVVHLLALAGRLGVDLPLERFDEIARRTPRVTSVRPAGEHLYEDLFRAGGIPAVLAELAPLLDLGALTVTGRTLGEEIADARVHDRAVIASLEQPFGPPGGLAVLRGSLAPDGAVLKVSAATPELLRHRGPAVVFDDIHDLIARIDDPALPVTADSVLVLKNAGPKGGPGMPEWGMLPIPQRLLREGVTDMVRVSDARMSGTGYGTCVLHVAPESAAGGPLAAVQDGDPIVLDVEERRLDLELPAAEIARRLDALPARPPAYRRGYGAIFLEQVLQADQGADFALLRRLGDEPADDEPAGLLEGWITGW